MHIISLKKLVEENDVNVVQVSLGEGVAPLSFDVGSQEYREQEKFLVKGQYTMHIDPATNMKVLRVERLEEGLEITLNSPTVIAEDAEDQSNLEEFVNTPVTAIVFNRVTLESAGRDVKRRHITAYAKSVVESYRKNFGEAELGDFAVIEIDFENRAVSLKSINIAEEESDTLEEEQERGE